MDIERFLTDCPPFDDLSEQQRTWSVKQMQSTYMNADNCNEMMRNCSPALFIVRSGVFDLKGKDGTLVERLEEGDLFGYPSLLSGRAIINTLQCIEDGIVYVLPQVAFDQLRNQSRAFERYFINAHGERLLTERRGKTAGYDDYDWTEQCVEDVIQRAPISLTSDTTIQSAAQLMSEHSVSSILVVDNDQLVGILTDRDIRNRVVAKGLGFNVTVAAVMTHLPESVFAHRSLLDALTTMTANNVHHLPVVDEQLRPVGMITATDLIKQQRSEPVYLISSIYKSTTRAQLVEEAEKIPQYLNSFALRVKQTAILGRLMASLTDAMTRQFIKLFEAENGAAPARYCWLAFGSQGREDQTLSSDQDNGLLLADGLSDSQLDWFRRLGEYVCEGLHDCGVPLCPGNIMASNPECRGTQQQWLARFERWTTHPTPKALMYCQIFFDSRAVAGQQKMFNQFREAVASLGKNEFFIGNLALLINRISVPLGLFNRFRTEDVEQGERIDIKRYGIALINDIVRLYALHQGVTEPATVQRIERLQSSRLISERDRQSLLEAWQFLTQLRLDHQLRVWHTDEPKNAIDPDSLSTLSRRQLKTAFKIIKQAQQGVGLKFSRQGY